jgi:hypothetical protein
MTEVAADRAKRIVYVIQALQLDPTRHSDSILAARTEALGLQDTAPETASVDAQENRRLRQQAIAALNQLRQSFWKLTQSEAVAELNRIAAFGFKELDAPLARLRVIACHRQSFHDLAAVTNAPPTFVGMLEDVFVLASRDAADLKESIRLAFRRLLWRRAPRRLVVLLKADLPELYGLEARWFDSLLKQRSSLFARPLKQNQPAVASHRAATMPQERNTNNWWIWIVIVIAANALRAFFNQP